jgi:hypothetical protein
MARKIQFEIANSEGHQILVVRDVRGEHSCNDRCRLCGLKIRNGGKHSYYLAQANIGVALVGHEDRAFVLAELLDDSSISLGAVAVGSECRKQLPAEFVGKW